MGRWSNDLTVSAVSPNVNEPWHLKNALLQGSRVGEAATIVLPLKKDGQMVQTCQNITQLISTIMTTSWLHHDYIMTTSYSPLGEEVAKQSCAWGEKDSQCGSKIFLWNGLKIID